MSKWVLLVICLAAGLPRSGYPADNHSGAPPKDPRAMLAAAAPFYNYSDPSLKPWHMRVIYQLYDETGKPTQKGSLDYWWASPSAYRATWTRSGSAYTVWHTADGVVSYEKIGDPLEFFERQLKSALLAPLPSAQEIDSGKYLFDHRTSSMGKVKLRCVMMAPEMQPKKPVYTVSVVPFGLFPTYCFDPDSLVLRVAFSWGAVAEVFDRIVEFQGRYLPQEVHFFESGYPILSARMEVMTDLDPSDPVLKPALDAQVVGKPGRVSVDEKVMDGSLIKKVQPIYPVDAKDARAEGTVKIEAIIGTDGAVHEMHIVRAAWPSLAASAMWAVSHWQFKPYLLNGKPVEVETTINVIYKLNP